MFLSNDFYWIKKLWRLYRRKYEGTDRERWESTINPDKKSLLWTWLLLIGFLLLLFGIAYIRPDYIPALTIGFIGWFFLVIYFALSRVNLSGYTIHGYLVFDEYGRLLSDQGDALRSKDPIIKKCGYVMRICTWFLIGGFGLVCTLGHFGYLGKPATELERARELSGTIQQIVYHVCLTTPVSVRLIACIIHGVRKKILKGSDLEDLNHNSTLSGHDEVMHYDEISKKIKK